MSSSEQALPVHATQAQQRVLERIAVQRERAKACLLHVVEKCVQAIVVEAQTVDQCPCLGQAEHAWFGVARLCLGRDGSHLDKPEAHGAQGIDAAGIFVQACSQAHAVGKGQSGQLDGVIHRLIAPGPLQRRALSARQHVHGEFVGSFGIHAKKKGAGECVGDQGHGEIIRQLPSDSPP